MNTFDQLHSIPATGDNLGWLIWLIIAILVIAAIAIVVFYFVRKKKTESKMDDKLSRAKHTK